LPPPSNSLQSGGGGALPLAAKGMPGSLARTWLVGAIGGRPLRGLGDSEGPECPDAAPDCCDFEGRLPGLDWTRGCAVATLRVGERWRPPLAATLGCSRLPERVGCMSDAARGESRLDAVDESAAPERRVFW
jgi:hypothetical protein